MSITNISFHGEIRKMFRIAPLNWSYAIVKDAFIYKFLEYIFMKKYKK